MGEILLTTRVSQYCVSVPNAAKSRSFLEYSDTVFCLRKCFGIFPQGIEIETFKELVSLKKTP